MSTFPSSNISTADIRYQLARDNTAGAQTPVTLNDGPVRAAANCNAAGSAVSFANLLGVNVFFSGTITFASRSISTGPSSFISFVGYSKYFPPQYGGAVGSVSTTSYYSLPFISGSSTPNPIVTFGYDASSGINPNTKIYFEDDVVPAPVLINTLYVTIDNTRYTFTNFQAGDFGFFMLGDPLNISGRSGQTCQIVITYT